MQGITFWRVGAIWLFSICLVAQLQAELILYKKYGIGELVVGIPTQIDYLLRNIGDQEIANITMLEPSFAPEKFRLTGEPTLFIKSLRPGEQTWHRISIEPMEKFEFQDLSAIASYVTTGTKSEGEPAERFALSNNFLLRRVMGAEEYASNKGSHPLGWCVFLGFIMVLCAAPAGGYRRVRAQLGPKPQRH